MCVLCCASGVTRYADEGMVWSEVMFWGMEMELVMFNILVGRGRQGTVCRRCGSGTSICLRTC